MASKATLVERLADYATALQYEQISPEAVRRAKLILFDTIGTGLGGFQRPLGEKTVHFVTTAIPGDEATLLGDGGRTSQEGAAFGNGTMVKILGMDDSHRQASHIASQVVPALLASAEANRASGSEMIVAMVAAYDLAVRVGRLVRQAQRERGLDVKGTVGTIAAALAAGRCAGLTSEELAHALALAADFAAGTEQYVYDDGKCDTKDVISGSAARNGMFAVGLARNGFYGPRGALDGEYGFFRAFGPGEFDPGTFDDLGRNFEILSTGFKPHGGCRHTHQAVDCVQQILERVDLDPSEIERVRIGTYGYATRPIFRVNANPPGRDVAGLSIRVVTAVALARGTAWPQDLAHWDEPEIRRLRNVMDVEIDPEIERYYPDKNGCRVEVFMRDGTRHEGYVEYAKGEPESPMSEDELRAKFEALNNAILPEGRADEIYRACMALETLEDAGDLMQLTVTAREVVLAGGD